LYLSYIISSRDHLDLASPHFRGDCVALVAASYRPGDSSGATRSPERLASRDVQSLNNCCRIGIAIRIIHQFLYGCRSMMPCLGHPSAFRRSADLQETVSSGVPFATFIPWSCNDCVPRMPIAGVGSTELDKCTTTDCSILLTKVLFLASCVLIRDTRVDVFANIHHNTGIARGRLAYKLSWLRHRPNSGVIRVPPEQFIQEAHASRLAE